MRISAKADYAVRAMTQLAATPGKGPVKAEYLAREQNLPLRFLLSILSELKHAHLVRSQRGTDGGYTLDRPPERITLADVIRVIDGPLYNVRDSSLDALEYHGPAERLAEVWMAVRASLRDVLEAVTIADLVAGRLPQNVEGLAQRYRDEASGRHPLP